MKKTIIAIIIMLTILVAGCTRTDNTQPINVYTGTEGVTIKFLQNTPQKSLYENSETLVIAEIWNKGAYSLNGSTGNYVTLNLNFDKLYFSGNIIEGFPLFEPSQTVWRTVQGKSQGMPYGERKLVQLASLKINSIPGTRESPKTIIDASVCYPYKTIISQMICIDSDIYGIDKSPVCRNRGTYTYSGQGAPVVISRIEADMIPAGIIGGSAAGSNPIIGPGGILEGIEQGNIDTESVLLKPSFNIVLRNAGQGLVFSNDDFRFTSDLCSITDRIFERDDLNRIRVIAYLGDTELKCRPSNIVTMRNNEGSVRCEVEEEAISIVNRNYETLLTVEAQYYYRSIVSTEITINRAS